MGELDDRAFRIVRRLGGEPDRAEALDGGVNRVFRVTGQDIDWVVRFPIDPLRPNEFPLEQWAARTAARAGIATPEVIAVDHFEALPFMVVRYVEPAAEQPASTWHWLGHYARLVSRLPLEEAPDGLYSRFGADLEEAWSAHLEYNLTALREDDPLLRDGGYRREDQLVLRALISDLSTVKFDFGLAHGDLAPRNLVSRGRESAPVLIDWGTATTGPAPWTDLQRVYQWAVHDQSVAMEELTEFAAGAGVPLDTQTTQRLAQLTTLGFLDLARWAHDRRTDLYDEYRRACRAGTRAALEGLRL